MRASLEVGPPAPRARGTLRRAWPVLRVGLGLAVAALVLWVVAGNRSELSGFTRSLDHLNWWWLPVGVTLEAASYVAFAGMQYRLFEAGGLRPPIGPLIGVTVGSQAITNSLPSGGVVAAVYGFRWYRRFGSDEVLAGWVLVGTFIGALFSLALLAAVGVGLAAGHGASFDLTIPVLGALVATLAAGAVFMSERSLTVAVRVAVHLAKRLTGRPAGEPETTIYRLVERATAVRLSWRDAGAVVGWGLGNWLLDCGCFAFCFLATGQSIPWGGLLLAYGAGQLAANLPITPGGLGVVEGSLTAALVLFGGQRQGSADAVLLYRLISYWGQLAVGWLTVGAMAWGVRRGRWARQSRSAPDRCERRGPGPAEVAMAEAPGGDVG